MCNVEKVYDRSMLLEQVKAEPAPEPPPGEIRLDIPMTCSSTSDIERPRYNDVVGKVLRQLLPPPVQAAIAGVIVGLMPSLRNSLVPNDSAFGWAYLALVKVGASAVPINMLILGSTLSRGPNWGAVSRKAALVIAFAKLIIMPALGFAVVSLLRRAATFAHMMVPDAAWLVALVVLATPTANNLNVMCQLAGQNSQAMATTIFIQYVVSPFAMIATVMTILLYVEA